MPVVAKNLASLFTLPVQFWVYLVVGLTFLGLILAVTLLAKRRTAPAMAEEPAQPTQTKLPVQVASALLDIGLETQEVNIRKALTHSLGLFLMSDLCGLLEKSPASDALVISQMFDLIRETHLEDFTLKQPIEEKTIHNILVGLPFIANHKQSDQSLQNSFKNATGYNEAGSLLVIPLGEDLAAPAILCLTPYTQREFHQQDIDLVLPLKPKLLQVLSKASDIDERVNAAETLRLSLKRLTRSHNQIQEQLIRSQQLLEEAKIKLADHKNDTTQEVALWVERQQALEAEVDDLTEKIAENLSAVQEAKEIKQQCDALEKALEENKRNISELNTTLANAQGVINQSIGKTEPAPSDSLAGFVSNASGYGMNNDPASLEAQYNQSIHQTAADFAQRDITLLVQVEPLSSDFAPLTLTALKIIHLMQLNAYKASPNHATVEITVSAQQDEQQNPALEILVTDQGGGISPQEQSHFLRFARSNHHPVPAGIGDAAALREVVQLVEQAGGHLWIHSAKDQLTTYRILLPGSAHPAEKSVLEK